MFGAEQTRFCSPNPDHCEVTLTQLWHYPQPADHDGRQLYWREFDMDNRYVGGHDNETSDDGEMDDTAESSSVNDWLTLNVED